MDIAVDFDGTVVMHEYPELGENVVGAVEVLKKLVGHNHNLILWTIRNEKELQDAVDWYAKHDIPLYGINCNPSQAEWTNSPKAYAKIYIDDAALGCPLLTNVVQEGEELKQIGKPFVDWKKIEEMLIAKGIIANQD